MKNSKEDFNRGLRGLTRINTLFYPCHPRNPWSSPLGCGEVALGVLRPSACCWSGPARLRGGYACEVVGAYHCRQTDPARKSVRRLRFRLVGYACGVVCSRYRWPACRASGNGGQKGAWNSGASEGMGAWCSGAAAAAACCLHGKQPTAAPAACGRQRPARRSDCSSGSSRARAPSASSHHEFAIIPEDRATDRRSELPSCLPYASRYAAS